MDLALWVSVYGCPFSVVSNTRRGGLPVKPKGEEGYS